ncbi:MAG: Ornithine carbamoyltransferase [Candidatus Heimdallarchaeota archaeon LC_3]|nr:MAG: Ornithine carbamoyltransferase [Candidatus Heimdallarchaeota archaeon LC_3]
MDLYGRNLLTLKDFTTKEIDYILDISEQLKKQHKSNELAKSLLNKSLGMIFQKKSTRTRVSSEVAMFLMGGHALFLGKDDIQLGVNETLKDTSLVLSRMVSGVLARVFEHSIVEELAEHSSIPIINALSDTYHPLQILADLLTIREKYQKLEGLKLAWVGDGNNVLHSLLVACPKMKIDLSVATPNNYRPNEEIVNYSKKLALVYNSSVELKNDPEVVVKNADIIVTDTFISMGQESETEKRKESFRNYQVNDNLVKLAKPDYIFMHCLPRHQEEVSDDVFYSDHSVVFDEAENRLYTAMGIFKILLSK